MIIALTGHRPHKLGGEYNGEGPVSNWLLRQLSSYLRDTKPEKVISGMAIGADMLWAEAAVNLQIPLIAAVPFVGQESKWPSVSQDRYKLLLAKAAEVVIVCEGGYASWKMQKRNEWMVDHSDVLLAVWDGSSGGTGNCVAYARSPAAKAGYIIDRINPTHFLAKQVR